MAYTPLKGHAREHGYNPVITASGETDGAVADLYGFTNYGLLIPTITSAALTFEASNLYAGTYYTVTDQAGTTPLTISSGTGAIAVESSDLTQLAGYRYIKIISSAAQGDNRTFIWTLKA